MARVINYKLEYNYDDESHVSIPELNGMPIVEMPYQFFLDDTVLDIEEYTYEYEFISSEDEDEDEDDDTFRDFVIIKLGGDGETAKGSQYPEMLTREEADCIVREFIETALGLEDFTVTTDSTDFIAENPRSEDEYDEYEEISRRAMYHEESGMSCGPVSGPKVADAEIAIEVDGDPVYLHAQWLSEFREYILFEATSESTYDWYEKMNDAEYEEIDELRKCADAAAEKKVEWPSDLYYEELYDMLKDVLQENGIDPEDRLPDLDSL